MDLRATRRIFALLCAVLLHATHLEGSDFGSKSLPLREAVESIPDVTVSSRRLPLRDSVEKRLPPDEGIDEDLDFERSAIKPIKLQSYDNNNYNDDDDDYYYNNNNYGSDGFYQQNRPAFSPLQRFQAVITGYQGIPYRIDDGFQQVFLQPGYPLKASRLQTGIADVKPKKVVCHVRSSAFYTKEPLNFNADNLDASLCTHVIYSQASLDPHYYSVIPADRDHDVVQGGYLSATGLRMENPDLKVLISIAGNRFTNSAILSHPWHRKSFIANLIKFVETHGFDGADLSWGSIGDEEDDKQNFASLLAEIAEVFRPKNLLISITAPASRYRIDEGYLPRLIAPSVDFVNVQTYDFHLEKAPIADHHAPLKPRPEDADLNLFNNVDYSVKYWLKEGLPRDKLVLGVPFFGRSFTLLNSNSSEVGAMIKGPGRAGYYTETLGFLAYFEICDMILNEGWQRETDAVGSPYLVNGDQWVGYDDVESIARKMKYVRDMELGGAHLQAADMDDFRGLCGEKFPLLNAVKSALVDDIEDATETAPMKPYGTCHSDGLYSDRRDCAAYFVCKAGFSYHLSCGEGLMFDAATGNCDYLNPSYCRPGETVHIPNAIKDLDFILRNEGVRDGRPKVVCYLTNWAFYRKGEGKFVPEHLDATLCTHVVYAFASLDPETLLMKEFDPWADLDNNLYDRITSIRDTQVLLSLGGWTDSSGDKYSRLVSDGSSRRKFVVGAVGFLRKHKFRGLHLDWNYPVCWQSDCKKGPSMDKANFAKLVQELKREFDKQSPPLVLAASISGYKEVIDVAYDLPALGRSLDFMSVMTYDYHGSWERKTGHVSPLFEKPGDRYPQYNTKYTMDYLVKMGAPKEKLIVGIPFYGQTFTLTKKQDGNPGIGTPSLGPGEPGEYTKQPGMLAYHEICNRVKNQRWSTARDSGKTSGPYAYSGDQWVGYDDPESVLEKAKYIRVSGYGGAVAWTVDLDDFGNRCCRGSFPLLRSINKGLGLIAEGAGTDNCKKPLQPVTPAPPVLTTGIDSGASSSTTESSWDKPSKKPTTTTTTTTKTTWWSEPSKKPTTTKPVTAKPTQQWTQASWWPTTSTTKKPSTSTVPPPAVVMPEIESSQEEPKKCSGGEYTSDPRNCNAYYRCILGEMRKEYCAGGLHWNNERKICDWPSSANCKRKSESTPTKRPKPTTKKPRRPTTTTTRRPTSMGGSNLETCVTGQYYPHEQCNSFYVCVNDQLVSQRCAPGLHWNADSKMCDWGYKVKCLNRKKVAQFSDKYMKVSKLSSLPYSPCEAGSFSAYSGDCGQYLICLWGKYEPFTCAPGLHWNTEKKICDWPGNAKCSDDDGEAGYIDVDDYEKPSYQPSTTRKPPITTTRKPKPTSTTTLAPLVPTEPLPVKSDYFKIVCYFTNWAWYRKGLGKYVPEDIDADLCTHIVYGFAVLDYENLIIKAHDSWADFDNKFYERVVAYRAKGLKVTIAIGGWNDSQGDKYSRLVNSPSARARFIKNVIEFIERHNFDGLDLDWEYPKCWQVDCKKGPDSDKRAFGEFVKELSAAFKPKGLLLSAAVSPSKTVVDAGYDVPAVAASLDWVAVMTYDFHGQWDKQTGHVAPLYEHPDDEVTFYNSNYSINYWISEGVPRRKIVMGMPLYGQSFRLENANNYGLNAKAPGPGGAGEFTRAAGFLAYYEICDRVKNGGWEVVQDAKRRMGPYAHKGNEWVSYDDKEMIRIKSEYIRRMDLGGGMIWALDLDDFRGRCGEGRHPLLRTIRKVLAKDGTGQQDVPQVVIERDETAKPVKLETTTSMKLETTTSKLIAATAPSKGTGTVPQSDYKVVCYFTNWAWYRQGNGKYLPSDIDPDLCTHIVYGFAVLNPQTYIIKPHDTWADFDNKFYEKVTEYRAKGIKVLIAIGGWNDSAGDKYSKLVNDRALRAKFISHVVEFIEKHNFDGLDLDWEYPVCWQVDCNKGPASDKEAFAQFAQELSAVFRPKNLLLSAAVSPSRNVVNHGYDVPALSKYLDWIAVMCYDYHGQWDKITGHVAPMYAHPEDVDVTFNTNFTIHYWIEKGADRKKLVLGMPMYGQSFSLAETSENGLNAPTYGGGEAGDQTRARGFLAYYEICQNIKNKGWNVIKDPKNRIGPYAYLRDQWVSYDDREMIELKSRYVKDMGLGGGMIWALDLDDFRNLCGCGEYPLLKTINHVLRGYPDSGSNCELAPPQSTKPPKKPTKKPSKPSVSSTTTTQQPLQIQQTEVTEVQKPCGGAGIFQAHESECNAYYLCNHEHLELQRCPLGLYWSEDHCDWPENSKCQRSLELSYRSYLKEYSDANPIFRGIHVNL